MLDLLFFLSGFSVVIKLKIRFIPGKTLLGIKNKSPKNFLYRKTKNRKKKGRKKWHMILLMLKPE